MDSRPEEQSARRGQLPPGTTVVAAALSPESPEALALYRGTVDSYKPNLQQYQVRLEAAQHAAGEPGLAARVPAALVWAAKGRDGLKGVPSTAVLISACQAGLLFPSMAPAGASMLKVPGPVHAAEQRADSTPRRRRREEVEKEDRHRLMPPQQAQ